MSRSLTVLIVLVSVVYVSACRGTSASRGEENDAVAEGECRFLTLTAPEIVRDPKRGVHELGHY